MRLDRVRVRVRVTVRGKVRLGRVRVRVRVKGKVRLEGTVGVTPAACARWSARPAPASDAPGRGTSDHSIAAVAASLVRVRFRVRVR